MRMHHHLSRRRRLSAVDRPRARFEPYPAATLWLRLLDGIVLAAGIVAPIFTLPQIILIYSTHHAQGVSALTWGVYALLDLPWIIYGTAHRERAIIYSYILWFGANVTVCLGAIMYGGGSI